MIHIHHTYNLIQDFFAVISITKPTIKKVYFMTEQLLNF